MSRETAIRNLQIITALDSLCDGLLSRTTPNYAVKLGATQFHVGILAAGVLIGGLLSPQIIKNFTYPNGKRYGLFFIFTTSLLMLCSSTNWKFIITMRILLSMVNQTQQLCLKILLEKEHIEHRKQKLLTNLNILNCSGLIVGPIIEAHLYWKEKGFRYMEILATFLILMNILLLATVEDDEVEINRNENQLYLEDSSLMDKIQKSLSENIQYLKNCKFERNWDIILIQFAFTFSYIVYFAKFRLLLNHNYHFTSGFEEGYTVAYLNLLLFVNSLYISKLKVFLDHLPTMFASELVLFLAIISMFLSCYAPFYEVFLLLLIPIVVLRQLIKDYSKQILEERNNDTLKKLDESVAILSGITAPILYGLAFGCIDHMAIKILGIVPLIMCWGTVKWYSKTLDLEDGDHDQCECKVEVK